MAQYDYCHGVPSRFKQRIEGPWLKIWEDVEYVYVLDHSPRWVRWIASFFFVILLSAELF